MAVPSVMNDLSATASSNSPAGTETIGTSLDDYLRAISAILRTTNHKGADIASAATTNIGAASGEFVDVTGTVTITALGTIGAGITRTVRFTGSLTLTHNATSLILPGGVNILTQNGDVAYFRSLGSGNWVCTGYMPKRGAAPLRLIDVQVFTSNGTWTRPLGALSAHTLVVGGGGAGGGAALTAAGQASFGGGGGGGGYVLEFITSGLGATETVTVGAGGAGVSGGAGNAGGTSSFGAHNSATGGGGGPTEPATGNSVIGAAAGAGGSGSGGSINKAGQAGERGISDINVLIHSSGRGGSSAFGEGGMPVYAGAGLSVVSSAGSAGGSYGGGGSGGLNTPSQAAVAGGAGGGGIVVVYAYGL